MTIKAKNEQKEITPHGNYIARCYSMIHLGTAVEFILGEEKILDKVRISWELPTELRVFIEEKGEQPMAISKEYTLSMHEKSNLRKDLEGWRGQGFTEDEIKEFDITNLLGIACMLSVIHKTAKSSGNNYAIISSIASLPKGTDCPEQINKTFEFNFEDMFDIDVLENLPNFIKERIKKSNEYRQKMNPENTEINDPNSESTEVNDKDDLPF